MAQKSINAVYMRGGTSKGLFFRKEWLPENQHVKEKILLRVMGSPDPYEKQIDGLGGATSSTSKIVIISPSDREDCDVDYCFGQISVDKPFIDWSGNCGNMTSAVGSFALSEGMLEHPENGTAVVRIWQSNVGARIIAHVPVRNGEVIEEGDYSLDGVAFPGAEIRLEYIEPCGSKDESLPIFPTGNPLDRYDIPGVGQVEMTLINASNPTAIVHASALGLTGNELQHDINSHAELLRKVEIIRSWAAVKMGLAATTVEATESRPHTPKLAFIAPPVDYISSGGKPVLASQVDINARIFSMGKLHHAMTGTGAIALAIAATLPGTLTSMLTANKKGDLLRMGHPSGTVEVGATVEKHGNTWFVQKAVMSRSARRLMTGKVYFPE